MVPGAYVIYSALCSGSGGSEVRTTYTKSFEPFSIFATSQLPFAICIVHNDFLTLAYAHTVGTRARQGKRDTIMRNTEFCVGCPRSKVIISHFMAMLKVWRAHRTDASTWKMWPKWRTALAPPSALATDSMANAKVICCARRSNWLIVLFDEK